ncbi:MAG: efflux RND transporter permease subunit, partial [Planctomycetes bacterium]|nr:efflux RND transporter permease subunit [Planctomycetota bacterium]
IKKRLAAIDGVARVHVWGIIEKRVEITLDPGRVDAHAVRLDKLVERLAQDNVALNAGTIREGEKDLLVRVDGKLRSFEEVEDYPADPQLRISDLAEVGYGRTVRDRMSRVNGHLSRVIVAHKESAANAVQVCQRIEAGLEELEDTLRRTVPGLTKIDSHAWMNQGELIRYSVDSVKGSGLWGGAFAVLVLYLFLRSAGLTVLVALAIPFSLLITVVWLFFRGLSFNILSLTGLALGVGMLVDNSIVVVENIVRHRAQGCSPREAAIRGLKEVGLAVSLATLTTVIVFLPGMFVQDPMARGFFTALGEPVSVSVLASLLVALVFIPQGAVVLERLRVRRAGKTGARLPSPEDAERFSWFNRLCTGLAGWCIRHRVEALLLTFGFFGFTSLLFHAVPKSDMPPGGPRRLEIRLKLQKNFTLSETNRAFAAAERVLLDPKVKEELKVRSVTSWFSATEGELNVFLEPGATLKEEEFFARIRPLLPEQPGVTYRMGFEDFARDEGGQRLRVFVRGNDLDRLEEIGAQVKSQLEDRDLFPELEEVSQWLEEETEEIRIGVARRIAQEYGTNTAGISRMVSWALRGAMLPDFEGAEREIPFWITYGERIKENAEEISAVRVFRPGAEPVRLENLASYAIVPGSGEIHRQNGKMTLGFSARVNGDFLRVRDRVEQHFQGYPLPEGFEVTLRQDSRGFEQDLANLAVATGLALVLVFFVMGVLFESYILPLSVLFSIPHAFFGAILLLWAMRVKLDMMGLLGMLMLVGIVVNNAIVLIDCVNRLRLEGMERGAAIVRSVQVRFRPIWMTALTTIFGLLPLLLWPRSGEGVDYRGLAVVLVGGLTTSTFFTLFVVPLFYTLLDDFRRALAGLARLDAARLRGLLRARAPSGA